MSFDGVMVTANLEECIFEEFDAVDVLAKIGVIVKQGRGRYETNV